MNYIPEDTTIVFQEIPGEISLSFSITGCGLSCPHCHSPYLQNGCNGIPLSWTKLCDTLSFYSQMVSCILFMGGDLYEMELIEILDKLKLQKYKTALYTGHTNISNRLQFYLDYMKLGPYVEEYGGLNNPTTNQRFYKKEKGIWIDATHVFQERKL